MLKIKVSTLLVILAFSLSQTPGVAIGQGKGGGKGHGGGGGHAQEGGPKTKGQGHGRTEKQVSKPHGRSGGDNVARGSGKAIGRSIARAERGRSGSARNKFTRLASFGDMPRSIRGFATSRRAQDVIVAAAVSHAFARGRGNDFRIDPFRNGMRIANRRGDPLVYLDDESARNLGRWRVNVVDDENFREGAPSFCRSGAGHPVWGREWCLEKGFGLGSYDDFGWGYTNNVGDVYFSRGSLKDRLIGTALEAALGTSTFNRLALHAVTLGLVDPLVGRWYAQPTGPQLMMVNSGTYPVAELVDVNRDYRADRMLVALRPW